MTVKSTDIKDTLTKTDVSDTQICHIFCKIKQHWHFVIFVCVSSLVLYSFKQKMEITGSFSFVLPEYLQVIPLHAKRNLVESCKKGFHRQNHRVANHVKAQSVPHSTDANLGSGKVVQWTSSFFITAY